MRVLTCIDWDEVAEECITSAWMETASGFFDLSPEDARIIIAAIVGLWAVAYVIKIAIREARYA